MTTKIRGSDVYVVEDLERILAALAGAARRYAGEYGAGYADALRDVAAGVGATTYDRQLQEYRTERVHEVIEYRAERTVERYTPPPSVSVPEWHFAFQDQQEAPPALAQTDVGFSDFKPGTGYLRRMDAGWMWVANSGAKTFFPVQQWAEISADEARSLGCLVADNRTFVLVLRSLLETHQRRLTGGQRRQLR